MFKPFLVDAGYREAQIGLWVGTWGMLCSIAGSVGGGLLARRMPLLRLVGWCAVARALPVAGEWWLTQVDPTPERILAVTCFEHLFGGALTTAMFAYMMSRVDRRIGATHYTLLAAVEVWGKLPAAWLSGFIAARASYATLFAVATVLSVAFLALLAPLARSRDRSRRLAAGAVSSAYFAGRSPSSPCSRPSLAAANASDGLRSRGAVNGDLETPTHFVFVGAPSGVGVLDLVGGGQAEDDLDLAVLATWLRRAP